MPFARSRSAKSPSWIVATVIVVVAMFVPVAFDRDSFPLSTYPMYSRVRQREVTIPTAVGIDSDGSSRRLSLAIIGASDDPLIVAGELRAVIAGGRAADRCAEIAERAARVDRELTHIEVVIERHDAVNQVSGEASMLERTLHARCPIGGST